MIYNKALRCHKGTKLSENKSAEGKYHMIPLACVKCNAKAQPKLNSQRTERKGVGGWANG